MESEESSPKFPETVKEILSATGQRQRLSCFVGVATEECASTSRHISSETDATSNKSVLSEGEKFADFDIDVLHDFGTAVAETLNCFCHFACLVIVCLLKKEE